MKKYINRPQSNHQQSFLHLIALLALPLIFLACNHAAADKTDKASQGSQADNSNQTPQLQTAEVTEGQLGTTTNLPGVLRAFEVVEVYPRVNGFVKDIPVDRGSIVKKGQLLVRLEAPELEQQYFSAKAKYLQVYALYLASKDNYDRLSVANRMPGTVSAHDLELARAKMIADSATAQGEIANYKALEATKDYLNVTAPFDGVISERNVHPGALVGPNLKTDDKPLLVLQQERKLRLVIDVPELYSNQLASHASLQFTVSTMPGKIFKGTISRSAGALNMKYRSEAIEVDVDNSNGMLKPGMYAEVQLPVMRSTKSMIVPSSAIITATDGKYVQVVKDGKTQKIDVTEGNSRNDSTEVFGSLNLHDKVVIK